MENCPLLDHHKPKSSDFITQSWGHRFTCLKINRRSINNIDSSAQNQHHKHEQWHRLFRGHPETMFGKKKNLSGQVNKARSFALKGMISPFPLKSLSNKVLAANEHLFYNILLRDGYFWSLRSCIPKLGNRNISHFHGDLRRPPSKVFSIQE